MLEPDVLLGPSSHAGVSKLIARRGRFFQAPPGSQLTDDEVDRTGGQTVQQEPDRIQLLLDEHSPYGAMRRVIRRIRRAFAPVRIRPPANRA